MLLKEKEDSKQKIIRDPIYGLIVFKLPADKLLTDILDTREFQRLKRIRQLGLSHFAYPNAVHDRFTHSLGVCHLLNRACGRLFKKIKFPLFIDNQEGKKVQLSKDNTKLLIRSAGLLHDIGHGPFSHAFEKIFKVNHEDLAINLLQNNSTELNKIITDFDDKVVSENFIYWITLLIQGKFSVYWIQDLISSQLDFDRIDYLVRDCYMCGLKAVNIDLDWLFEHMTIAPVGEKKVKEEQYRLVIDDKKGIYLLEGFVVSRFHMYEQVYYHKTTRCAEQILLTLIGRVIDLIKCGDSYFNNEPFSNLMLEFLKNKNNLDLFLLLDDFYIFSVVNWWSKFAEDFIVKELAKCLMERNLFKLIKESEGELTLSDKEEKALTELLLTKCEVTGKLFKDYFLIFDNYRNNPYRDTYLLGEEEKDNNIFVGNQNQVSSLTAKSLILKNIRKEIKKKNRVFLHRGFLDDFIQKAYQGNLKLFSENIYK